MGRDVVLVSSADETAFEVARVLAELDLARPAGGADPEPRFISSGDVNWFEELGRRLLGPELTGPSTSVARRRCRPDLGVADALHGDPPTAVVRTVPDDTVGLVTPRHRPRLLRHLRRTAPGVLRVPAPVRDGRRCSDAGPGTLANLQEHVALDELDADRRQPRAPRPLARGAGPAQRVAVRARGRGDRPCSRTGRDARHGRADLPAPGSARPSGPTADHRPVGRSASATCRSVAPRTDHPPETLAVRVDCRRRVVRLLRRHRPGLVARRRSGRGLDLALVRGDATSTATRPRVRRT